MKESKSISDGGRNFVIMVYGHELKKCSNAAFYKWLKTEDFECVSYKGYYANSPWVYVNLQNKTYFPAIPGFKITDVLNDHAVTIEEFHKIQEEYNRNSVTFYKTETVVSIYKKYKGKDPLVFKEHRFDCDEGYKEELKLIEKKEQERKKLNDRTLCFIYLNGITAIESGDDYILQKESLEYYIDQRHGEAAANGIYEEVRSRQDLVLPDKGIYAAELHQQGIPGEEYVYCNVEFSKEDMKLKGIRTETEGPDLLRDLRIFKNKHRGY